MIRRALLFLGSIFAGCVIHAGTSTKAPPIDTTFWIDRLDAGGDSAPRAQWERTLLVDSDFTSEERDEIAEGAKEWENALDRELHVAIRFSLVNFPHGFAHVAGKTRVTRLRSREQLLVICPYFNVPNVVGCVSMPEQDVFLVPDLVTSVYLPQLAAHEIGHVIGLLHASPPSVMALETQSMSIPTKEDAQQFCERVGVCR